MDDQQAALYDYYVPGRYNARAMRSPMASRGFFTTPSGAKIYSSTGEDAGDEGSEDVTHARRSGNALTNPNLSEKVIMCS